MCNVYEVGLIIPRSISHIEYLTFLKEKVCPVIKNLKAIGMNWYCFLVHSKATGAPIEDETALAIHLRIEIPNDKLEEAKSILKEWEEPRPTKRDSPHDWDALNECSEFIMNLISGGKQNAALPHTLLHYIFNMLGITDQDRGVIVQATFPYK
jgi:hypothetical protein